VASHQAVVLLWLVVVLLWLVVVVLLHLLPIRCPQLLRLLLRLHLRLHLLCLWLCLVQQGLVLESK
jgi:hypothetical protein